MGALDRARPHVLRLRSDQPAEELSRDLVEAWTNTEVALRSLLGGSALGGPALIRALSVQGLLTLEQAHALVDFQAARSRAELPDYHPQGFDLEAARRGFAEIEQTLLLADGASTQMPEPAPPTPGKATAPAMAGATSTGQVAAGSATRRGLPSWLVLFLAVLVLVTVAALGYWFMGSRGGGAMAEGERLYAGGDRNAARMAFVQAAKADPENPLPHVYLGRIAREQGEFSIANQELATAIRLDPASPLALREMGSLMFATGNYPLARNFYVRAIQVNAADTMSLGYLGCTLTRMGRPADGERFLRRAGPGPWSNCLSPAPGGPPGAMSAPGRIN
jgi:Flp pilus assembly protein TadD